MPLKRKSHQKLRRFVKSRLFAIAALLTVVVVIASVTAIIVFSLPHTIADPEPFEKIDDFFIYDGRPVPIAKGVKENPYDSGLFQMQDNGRMTYNSDSVKTFVGIDVSSHQDKIDWVAVKNSGVDFAMIRAGFRGATEGNIYLDNTFNYNISNAEKAGIDIGIYFFSQATTVEEAHAEAALVLRWIKGYDITYPIVFDWEFQYGLDGPLRTEGITDETLTDCALEFCNVIFKAGYIPMVYFNLHMAYSYFDLDKLSAFDFWIAEHDEAAPNFYYDFAMYQYTNRCVVPGVPAPVDMNLCFVDYAGKGK